MKKVLLTICLALLLKAVIAQEELPGKELSHYVFPAFVDGTVKKKSGEIVKASLNYNTITEEMIFDQAGQKLALDKLEDIDTVYIQDKKFVPFEKVFYEVAANTPVALFIQHKSEIIPPGNNTGFGTSNTSAITNLTDFKTSGSAYKLQLPEDFKIRSKTAFWLRKNNNYALIKTEKNVEDLFPDKADAIKKFVKTNKINFKNPDDLIKLTVFCN